MKKKTPSPLADHVMTPSSGNVFLDMGFEPAEAAVLLLRADLMVRLRKYILAQAWTQAETAEHLGINQPRVSKLTNGVWQDFSLDMLLIFAARLGLHPELRLAA